MTVTYILAGPLRTAQDDHKGGGSLGQGQEGEAQGVCLVHRLQDRGGDIDGDDDEDEDGDDEGGDCDHGDHNYDDEACIHNFFVETS